MSEWSDLMLENKKPHRKTLIFLSPNIWDTHNQQIQLFAKSLSIKYNVVYVCTSAIDESTISISEFTNANKLRRLVKFLVSLMNRSSFIQAPIFITLHKYSGEDNISPSDKFLYKLQVRLTSLILSFESHAFMWCTTVLFDGLWKEVRGVTWIYDFFDRYPNETKKVIENEKWLLNNSARVLVNSDYYFRLATKALKKTKMKSVIKIPVGYDLNRYLKVSPYSKKGKVTVGYQGGISDRMDFELTLDTIIKNPDINFVFVGPIYLESNHFPKKQMETFEFIGKLKRLPNVKIVKFEKSVKKLATIISSFNIGWIPYNTRIKFNKFSTPNKFYEYSAVGLPVISTPLGVLKEFQKTTFFFKTPEQFSKLVRKITLLNSKNYVLESKKIAVVNNIDKKLNAVIDILSKLD